MQLDVTPAPVVPAPVAAPTQPPLAFRQAVDEMLGQTVGTGHFSVLFGLGSRTVPMITRNTYGPVEGYELLSQALTAAGQHVRDTLMSDRTGQASVIAKIQDRYVPLELTHQMLTTSDGGYGTMTARFSHPAIKSAVDGLGYIMRTA